MTVYKLFINIDNLMSEYIVGNNLTIINQHGPFKLKLLPFVRSDQQEISLIPWNLIPKFIHEEHKKLQKKAHAEVPVEKVTK